MSPDPDIAWHARSTAEVLDQIGSDPSRGLTADCLLYTSDAADERSSVDLGGRRIIKKKNTRIYG